LVTKETGEFEGRSKALEASILEGLEPTFDGLIAMLESEVARLGTLLGDQLKTLVRLCDVMEKSAAAQLQILSERLKSRITEFYDSFLEIDEGRLATEVAFLTAKSNIREELDRFREHIQAAEELVSFKVGAGEAVGRKLDFLCQEFSREANTICSKSADMDLTKTGLEIKTVVKQFRDQTQNIE
jgi:uncharacterized protein (TIGR00255 family)